MATYRNKQDDTIIRGSEFKLNISIDSKGEYHMSDVVFTCTFMCGGKTKTLTKSDMRAIYKEGEDYSDNYVAPLDTNDFGKGVLTVRYIADIPDADFGTAGNADNKRHEIIDIKTKIKIV
jgi:hypothetical protein